MLCGQMPHLMPALQPPSVSRWLRATAVTEPWRSSCIPVVRDWGTQWASSDQLQDYLGSIFQVYMSRLEARWTESASRVGLVVQGGWTFKVLPGHQDWAVGIQRHRLLQQSCVPSSPEPHQPHLMLEAGSLSSAEYEARVRARRDFQRLQRRNSDVDRQV